MYHFALDVWLRATCHQLLILCEGHLFLSHRAQSIFRRRFDVDVSTLFQRSIKSVEISTGNIDADSTSNRRRNCPLGLIVIEQSLRSKHVLIAKYVHRCCLYNMINLRTFLFCCLVMSNHHDRGQLQNGHGCFNFCSMLLKRLGTKYLC